ncbi:MAG: hypothetical protein WC891_06545 [Actinomycetota bacterium]
MIDKRIYASTLILTALYAGIFLVSGCASRPLAESIAKGKELAYSRCTTCHAASTFEHHRYSRAGWLSVIKRMMEHGAQYTPEEKDLLADFLSTKFGKE